MKWGWKFLFFCHINMRKTLCRTFFKRSLKTAHLYVTEELPTLDTLIPTKILEGCEIGEKKLQPKDPTIYPTYLASRKFSKLFSINHKLTALSKYS